MPTIQDRFVMRRGLAADLASVNEVPLQGEWILTLDAVDDSHRLKIGDGTTHYNDLPYIATGSGGAAGGIVNVAGSTYTFQLSDVEQTVISGNVAASTFTVPANADAAFAVGARIAYTQGGDGALTIAGAAGVTLHANGSLTTLAKWDGGVIEKIDADTWQVWSGTALGTMATKDDAPSDGKTYGRKNGAWAEASGGSSGANPSLVGINDQTGTAYTTALADAGKDVRCTNAAAVTLTVPTNAAVAFPVGTLIAFSQGGAGAVTATGASGVTINGKNGTATTGQYDARVLEYLGSDTWRVW